MNLYRGIITICLLLTTASVGYAQSDKAAAQKEIEADYARTAKAWKQKDTKALFGLMTKDATFKEANGSLTPRVQLETMMKQMFTMMTYSSVASNVTKWTWQDKAALLDVTIKSAGTMKTPDGKTHAVTYVSKSRDHWVKQADGWHIKQIEAISETMTQDGKPVVIPVPTPKK